MGDKKPTWITYIGNRVYTPQSFEEEAKTLGVSRAIPHLVARKLKAGDRIYTLFKRDKYSIVTGYFVVDGYSFTGPDADKIRKLIREKPEEFGINECYAGSGRYIQRGCGGYVDSGGCYTSNLEETINKVIDIVEENGWKVKFFVNGRYYPLPKKRRVQLPFTRSVVDYYLDLETAEEEPLEKTHIGFMNEYEQKKYRKKTRKKRRKTKKTNKNKKSS